jgi:hypothetical protein
VLEDHCLLLQQLSSRWQQLEERIKAAEQITGAVTIPAINELRYSGRRFFEAWMVANNADMTPAMREAFHDHVLMAVQYFNNADHDLTDALITFFSERRYHFLRKYGVIKGTVMYSTIMGWFEKIDAAQKIILHARGNRQSRMEDYVRLEKEYLPELIDRYKQIIYSEILYVRRHKIIMYWTTAERVVVIAAAVVAIVIYWDTFWGKVSHALRGVGL